MMIAQVRAVLLPYATNFNTGNLYEIVAILDLLRRMGMTDDDLATTKDLRATIVATNTKKGLQIASAFEEIRKKPVGTGLTFDGKRITAIVNVTQDDKTGGTGDLLLTSDGGETYALSITGGTAKRKAGGLLIEKCLTNPTAKRFGCTPEDIAEFKAIGCATVPKYKAEMTECYSADESRWPSRKKTKSAFEAQSIVAQKTVERFNTLSSDAQIAVFKDLLGIDGVGKPADYLALVHPKKMHVSYYIFDVCCIDTWHPKVTSDGVNIYMHANTSQKIGSTQVKFNNGVWHKGKTSSIHSSWNVTFYLTDLFRMKPCPL